MKITIMTSLSAKRNMNINTGHFKAKLQKFMQKIRLYLFLVLMPESHVKLSSSPDFLPPFMLCGKKKVYARHKGTA